MRIVVTLVALSFLVACGPAAKDQALVDVKAYVSQNLTTLKTSASALRAAAPAADSDGWNASADAAALTKMRAEWKKARAAYEHVEGAIAVLFPELDVSSDERYDGFIATEGDDNLFDGEGVTGIHAVERILWSNETPSSVHEFEAGLPYYAPSAFPANATQAGDFKNKLLARLETDIQEMEDGFTPLALDPSAAYRGVIGSMEEQVEKVNKASTGEEESRYAQYTLADMRANVEGGVKTYEAFQKALLEQSGGKALDEKIQAGFDRIEAKYASFTGDALPAVPEHWSAESPSAEHLATPFGQLYSLLQKESDPDDTDSLVHALNESADLLQIPRLPEE